MHISHSFIKTAMWSLLKYKYTKDHRSLFNLFDQSHLIWSYLFSSSNLWYKALEVYVIFFSILKKTCKFWIINPSTKQIILVQIPFHIFVLTNLAKTGTSFLWLLTNILGSWTISPSQFQVEKSLGWFWIVQLRTAF